MSFFYLIFFLFNLVLDIHWTERRKEETAEEGLLTTDWLTNVTYRPTDRLTDERTDELNDHFVKRLDENLIELI